MKSRYLFSAATAGIFAATGAVAADLPVKAKAIEYVKVCSLYGAGFYYIPGTDTCIKFGGYLRVDLGLGTASDYNINSSGTNGEVSTTAAPIICRAVELSCAIRSPAARLPT